MVAKVIHCECGYDVRGEDDQQLLDRAEQHVQQSHPDLVGKLTRDDLLEMAEEE